MPLNSSKDVNAIFANYCGGGLTTHPWSELEGLQPETVQINEKLVELNKSGFLTINSQPAVNGEKSDSPSVGMYHTSYLYCHNLELLTVYIFVTYCKTNLSILK